MLGFSAGRCRMGRSRGDPRRPRHQLAQGPHGDAGRQGVGLGHRRDHVRLGDAEVLQGGSEAAGRPWSGGDLGLDGDPVPSAFEDQVELGAGANPAVPWTITGAARSTRQCVRQGRRGEPAPEGSFQSSDQVPCPARYSVRARSRVSMRREIPKMGVKRIRWGTPGRSEVKTAQNVKKPARSGRGPRAS